MSVRRVGLSRSLRPWGRVVGGDLLTQQLADGPLAAWPMQETSGTTMLDASGNGRHGTYSGSGIVLAQAPIIHGAGRSVEISSNGQSTVADADWLDVAGMTFEVVMVTSSNYRFAVSRTTLTVYVYRATASGAPAGMATRGYTSGVVSAGGVWPLNAPLIVAFTYEYPGQARVYINGNPVIDVPAAEPLQGAAAPLLIGNNYSSGVARYSHAAFYDRALSADDILRHAQVAGLA